MSIIFKTKKSLFSQRNTVLQYYLNHLALATALLFKQNKQAILKNITSSSVSQQYIKPFYFFDFFFLFSCFYTWYVKGGLTILNFTSQASLEESQWILNLTNWKAAVICSGRIRKRKYIKEKGKENPCCNASPLGLTVKSPYLLVYFWAVNRVGS